MEILSDEEYLKLIKSMSEYEIRVVEDKIYGLPKYKISTIHNLYGQSIELGNDICDSLLIYDYYNKSTNAPKKLRKKKYIVV